MTLLLQRVQLKCLDISTLLMYLLVQWPSLFFFSSAVANFGQKMVIRYQKPICLIQQMQESEGEVSGDDMASSL